MERIYFSDSFILRVNTPSGFAHFILSNSYLHFFNEMQICFDRNRFVKYCHFISSMRDSDIFDDEIFGVDCFSIHNL